jgi:hypothetical protein
MLAALAVASAALTSAQAAGNAVNTMGAPYYKASYFTLNWLDAVVDGQIVDNADSTSSSLGVHTVIGSLWNSLPAIQQAVVTNDGATFWARASAPRLFSPPNDATAVGGITRATVAQSFTKSSADAQLRFTYSGGLLQSYVDAEVRPPCDAPGDGPTDFCTFAAVMWDVSIRRNDTQDELMQESGFASLEASGGEFVFDSGQDALNGYPVNPVWSWDCPRCGMSALGLAEAKLQAPFAGIVDLSAIPFDPALAQQPEFTVEFRLTAYAIGFAEWVGATAWARDPLDLGTDAGVGFTVLDLQPTNNPVGVVPEPATALLLAAGLCAVLARRRPFVHV